MTKPASIAKLNKDHWIEKVCVSIRDGRKAALFDEGHALAHMIYESVVTPGLLDQMNALPREFFRRVDKFLLGGTLYSVNNDDALHIFIRADMKPVPMPTFFWGGANAYNIRPTIIEEAMENGHVSARLGKKLVKMTEEMMEKVAIINKDIQSFRESAWVVLNTVRNTKQLRSAWPDIADDFIAFNGLEKNENKSLPAIPMAPLNAIVQEHEALKKAA